MQFARAKKISVGLDMTPIIDCILQLLIFFMLTSSFSGGLIRLMLPEATATEFSEPNEIVISATAEGTLFVQSEQVGMESLVDRLRLEINKSPQSVVVFRGDEKVPYRVFVEITDRVRQAGVQRYRIAHALRAERQP